MSNKAGKIPVKRLVKKKDGTQYVGTFYINPEEYKELTKKTQKTSVDQYTDKNGKWLPERVKEHKRIISRYVESCPKPQEGEKPTAILLLGGAASGKSTVVNKYLIPKYGDRFGTINSDDLKAELGDRATFDKYSMEDVMTAASRVHAESSMLAKKVTNQTIEEGRNLIYDGVLGDAEKAKGLIKSLQDKGYNVKLVGVNVNAKDALKRAKLRALGNMEDGGEKRGSGRYVPDKTLIEGHIGSAKTFEEIKDLVNDFELYDNNVAFGKDPIKVIENGEVLDEDNYKKFKEKAKDSVSNYLSPSLIKKALDYIRNAFGNSGVSVDVETDEGSLMKADISRIGLRAYREYIMHLGKEIDLQKSFFDEKIEEFDEIIKASESQPILSRLEQTKDQYETKYLTERKNLLDELNKAEATYTESINEHIELLKAVSLDSSIESWNEMVLGKTGDFKYKEWLTDTLERTRDTMPQIDSSKIDEVVLHFSQSSPDAKVEKKSININDIKFSQNEINEDKVLDLMEKMDAGNITDRFLVAGNKKDGYYLIDGHHRLCALCELSDDLELPCYLIKLPAKEAIRRLNLMKITKKEDIKKSEFEESFNEIKKAFNEDLVSLDTYLEAKEDYEILSAAKRQADNKINKAKKVTIIGGEEVPISYIEELYNKYCTPLE